MILKKFIKKIKIVPFTDSSGLELQLKNNVTSVSNILPKDIDTAVGR